MSPEPGLGPACRALAAACALLAAGCGGDGAQVASAVPPARALELDSLTFVVGARVNEDRPVRAELVRVRDARLFDELMRIETSAWFGAGGQAFRATHPNAFYDDWELVPGRLAGPFDVAVDARVAGVLFCEMRAVSPPLSVERNGDVTVEIDDDDCVLGGGLAWSREVAPGLRRVLNPLRWFE